MDIHRRGAARYLFGYRVPVRSYVYVQIPPFMRGIGPPDTPFYAQNRSRCIPPFMRGKTLVFHRVLWKNAIDFRCTGDRGLRADFRGSGRRSSRQSGAVASIGLDVQRGLSGLGLSATRASTDRSVRLHLSVGESHLPGHPLMKSSRRTSPALTQPTWSFMTIRTQRFR